jgi:hypothetical protein
LRFSANTDIRHKSNAARQLTKRKPVHIQNPFNDKDNENGWFSNCTYGIQWQHALPESFYPSISTSTDFYFSLASVAALLTLQGGKLFMLAKNNDMNVWILPSQAAWMGDPRVGSYVYSGAQQQS